MAGEPARKRVGIRLPRHVNPQSAEQRWAHELEALAPIADIVEVHADTPAEFVDGAGDLDAIITSWGIRIDQEIIGALKRCVVIGVGSVGVDMVDVEAATVAGIVVTNVPDVFIEEVADHAMMLLLNVARMTPLMARMAREGQWYEARPILSRRDRLLGSTLGLYSFGNVARCHRPPGEGLRPAPDRLRPLRQRAGDHRRRRGAGRFSELLERSDFLSIHTPHNAETEHSINAAALAPDEADGGPDQHCARADRGRAALIEALRDGVIAGAGLDVIEQEPPAPDNPLLTMDNVIVTPHIASARTRMRPEDTPPRRPRGGHGPARPVADELRQPDCVAAGGARAVAALPDEPGSQPMKVVTAIAKAMKAEGVEILFAYPVNPLIEAAAEEDIRTVIVRQERTGLHMADAYSRMSSGEKFGVFCMQHGPGSENAFGGVAQAFSESSPILVIPGGYPRHLANYYPNFNSTLNMQHITKWAEPVTSGRAVPDLLRRAFFQLRNGRPGPVLLEVPADLWNEEVPDGWVHVPSFTARSAPDPADRDAGGRGARGRASAR